MTELSDLSGTWTYEEIKTFPDSAFFWDGGNKFFWIDGQFYWNAPPTVVRSYDTASGTISTVTIPTMVGYVGWVDPATHETFHANPYWLKICNYVTGVNESYPIPIGDVPKEWIYVTHDYVYLDNGGELHPDIFHRPTRTWDTLNIATFDVGYHSLSIATLGNRNITGDKLVASNFVDNLGGIEMGAPYDRHYWVIEGTSITHLPWYPQHSPRRIPSAYDHLCIYDDQAGAGSTGSFIDLSTGVDYPLPRYVGPWGEFSGSGWVENGSLFMNVTDLTPDWSIVTSIRSFTDPTAILGTMKFLDSGPGQTFILNGSLWVAHDSMALYKFTRIGGRWRIGSV